MFATVSVFLSVFAQYSERLQLMVLALSSALLLLVFLLSFVQNRRYAKNKLEALLATQEWLDGQKDCDIAHLDELRKERPWKEDAELESIFELMENERQRLYHGSWIPESRHYLRYQKILPFAKRRLLRPELALNLLLVGALATVAMILLPLIAAIAPHYLFALLPLLFALALAAWLLTSNRRLVLLLNDAAAELRQSVARCLPEYSEKSGTALLIDEFMRYDRQMSASSALLSQKVEELNDQKLIDTVASSIESVLERQIAPALGESNQALSKLCVELSRQQSDGVSALAQQFSDALGETVSRSLSPLEKQVQVYAENVHASKHALDLAFEQFDQYRAQSQKLDEQIMSHISLLGEQSQRWNEGLEGLRQVSGQISQNNQQMTRLQAGSEETLAGKLELMAKSIEAYGQMNRETLANLRQENSLLNQMLADTQSESAKVLSEYRHLTQRITISAMDIEKHNGEISENITKLSSGLEDSVKHFTGQMQSGVDLTLGDFDSSLAELTERLSHSATAIRDSVARLVDAVQRGGE